MPTASASSSLPAVGEVVAGKYRIDRLIAEGGMGVVYEAMHLHLDELVAIKFLRADFINVTDGEIAGRFIREARASAKIKSEHVTRVHDVGKLDSGAPYIVMERLHGQDLELLVEKQGVLAIETGIDYILQASEALAEAHAIGMVHRDLKPANLFLTHRADGSACVKVLDFGISKFKDAAGGEMNITKTHAVMGSPRYMSPEQMRSSRDVDARADVWAIGIILYELFAGTVPFDGESMPQICAAILQDEPKSLRALRPDVTPELEAVVAKCLEKKAVNRFQNLVPLARALAVFGSADGRVSAERISRVLGHLGTLDTAPREFSIPPGDTGRLPAVRVSTTEAAATAVAWTGNETQPTQKRKRAVVALGVVAFVGIAAAAGIGAVAIHYKSNVVAAQPVATAAANPPNVTPEPTTATTPATTAAASTPAPIESAAPSVDPAADQPNATTTASATKSATKKALPASHPTAAAHPTTSAQTTAPTTPATTPTSTPSTSAGDMWGERK